MLTTTGRNMAAAPFSPDFLAQNDQMQENSIANLFGFATNARQSCRASVPSRSALRARGYGKFG
jgi:hypothetical protein